MKSNLTNIINTINENGCFDLQFRKDTRRERTGSPTYYRWKIQFVVTVPKSDSEILKKISGAIGCGKVYLAGNQARLTAQKIEAMANCVVPFLRKNSLSGNKKKDFELWRRAVEIIFRNQGKQISKWQKSDLLSLMEIHKTMAKYKNKTRKEKWLDMAETIGREANS